MRRTTIIHPALQEVIAITTSMQRNCIETYLAVANTLESGMSEADIAERVRQELKNRGYSRYWYTISILVLIGPVRFLQMADPDYSAKNPSKNVFLQEGDTFFIDMHPMHIPSGCWGNFGATGLYRSVEDFEQITFLNEMQFIQMESIRGFKPEITARDVSVYFQGIFQERAIELVDVRFNIGHAMQRGPKRWTRKSFFLDENNYRPIGNRILGIEPGGKRNRRSGKGIVVARFEQCVYMPENSSPIILGHTGTIPTVFQ
jgi:Metallopeptidase family M24